MEKRIVQSNRRDTNYFRVWHQPVIQNLPESICFTSLIHCKCFPEETGLKYFRTASVNCIPGGASIRAPFKNPVTYACELQVHRPVTSIRKMLPTTSSSKHVFPYNSQTNDLVSEVILSTVLTKVPEYECCYGQSAEQNSLLK